MKCQKQVKRERFLEASDQSGRLSLPEGTEKKVVAQRRYHQNYNKKSPWMGRYSDARQRCLNPNHKAFRLYGGVGIKFLMTKNDFKVLWFRDKAYLMKKPSIDRINNDGDYYFDNCQFIELAVNCVKDHVRKVGMFEGSKMVKSFESILDVAKEGFDRNCVGGCCRGQKYRKTHRGFAWKFI